MHALAFLLLAHLAAAPGSPGRPVPLELTNNKPFVPVTVNGSTPQWFILDTGCSGTSIVARETAERLKLALGAEARADVGAGSGADVRISQAKQPVTLVALGETLTVVEPRLLTLGHVARYEGRRVDGLLGGDFMFRHVVTLDYADRTIAVGDTTASVPPPGALVVPLDLDTGWPVAAGTITPRGGKPIPCRMIVDTGVRGVVTLFAPFSAAHGLVDASGSLPDLVVGGGAGGLTRGDVVRLEALTMGPLSIAEPVAVISRDTAGIFTLEDPQAIVGGELLKRHRVTFDYAHGRMILEPYADHPPYEYDMSGLFLAAEGGDDGAIRILAVHPRSPAAEAGLRDGDRIVALDGKRAPRLTLDEARRAFRVPGAHRLEVRREGKVMRVRLEARRLI